MATFGIIYIAEKPWMNLETIFIKGLNILWELSFYSCHYSV